MALPICFRGRTVQGKRFSDGGQGGWQTRQGNTPVDPLIHAGCDLVIVMHTEEGSPWDRGVYPNTTFIEIRPQQKHKNSSIPFGDLFETDEKILLSWISQGYEDARRAIYRVEKALQVRHDLRSSK